MPGCVPFLYTRIIEVSQMAKFHFLDVKLNVKKSEKLSIITFTSHSTIKNQVLIFFAQILFGHNLRFMVNNFLCAIWIFF